MVPMTVVLTYNKISHQIRKCNRLAVVVFPFSKRRFPRTSAERIYGRSTGRRASVHNRLVISFCKLYIKTTSPQGSHNIMTGESLFFKE